MTDTPPLDRPPLWRLMADAYAEATNSTVRDFDVIATGNAAEIRALADAVVPDEPEPPTGEREPWPQAYQQMSDAKWEQRQRIRALLLAEAERAEEGR
jgi:hypothetical protein